MAGCISSIMWKRGQRGNALNHCLLAGSVVSTRWGGSTLSITSREPPHGNGPQWRRCVITSSGSTSAASYRAAMQQFNQRFIFGVSLCLM
ncbi:hypothetical protein E3U43_013760 [Larimichthys crocea]|uniref:Uncharacterized protein n=1 Tax=Larimichthys crocea TaxID=215358 RepID=A0ACD3RAX2_LARCR|nr:hypothetical protein E3U43_013760 [Larimichthys crocea]